ERIRKAIASLEKSVGARPLGWYCRYGPSLNTRQLLVEEGGFLYDSDCYNDELPYWVRVHARAHLVSLTRWGSTIPNMHELSLGPAMISSHMPKMLLI